MNNKRVKKLKNDRKSSYQTQIRPIYHYKAKNTRKTVVKYHKNVSQYDFRVKLCLKPSIIHHADTYCTVADVKLCAQQENQRYNREIG